MLRKARTASPEIARPNSQPCASEQPKLASAKRICSDSTPSAVIGTSRLWPSPAIVLTIAAVCSLLTIVVMKLLSILIRSSGSRLTWASDA